MNDLIILDRDKVGSGEAVPTKQGLSAIERASNRWWKVDLPEIEDARHQRMMDALRRLDPKPTPIRQGPWRPGAKWRYLRHEHQNDLRRMKCERCKRTGELTVSDGTGCIDFELCPACQRSNPFRRVEAQDVTAF